MIDGHVKINYINVIWYSAESVMWTDAASTERQADCQKKVRREEVGGGREITVR